MSDRRRDRIEGRTVHEEKTEVGDIAKSLMRLLDSHYASTRFNDVLTSTRLTPSLVQTVSVANSCRVIAKIFSIGERDLKDDTLTDEEREELNDMMALKRRMMGNEMTLAFTMWDSWLKTFIMGLQSLDGMSRQEGVEISSGATRRLMQGDELGAVDKLRKLIGGNVRYV
jgi:hypothetical protein